MSTLQENISRYNQAIYVQIALFTKRNLKYQIWDEKVRDVAEDNSGVEKVNVYVGGKYEIWE